MLFVLKKFQKVLKIQINFPDNNSSQIYFKEKTRFVKVFNFIH